MGEIDHIFVKLNKQTNDKVIWIKTSLIILFVNSFTNKELTSFAYKNNSIISCLHSEWSTMSGELKFPFIETNDHRSNVEISSFSIRFATEIFLVQ